MSDTAEEQLIKWDNITSENDPDPIGHMLERAVSEKKKRGRPRKTPTPEEVPVPEHFPGQSPPADQGISSFSSLDLIEAVRANSGVSDPTKKSISPQVSGGRSPRKSALRFSADLGEPESEEPDTKWIAAVQTYRCFFTNPKLRSKHMREERTWTNKDSPEKIIKECKELQALCSPSDPASVLGTIWVQCMAGIEAGGPAIGIRTDKLGSCAEAVASRDDFQETMRELLIKYPYLRLLVTLGGFPELRLAIITITMINEIHHINTYKEHMANMSTPDKPFPEDLRNAFSGL